MSDHAITNCSAHLENIKALTDARSFCLSNIEGGRDLSRDAKQALRDHAYDGTNPDGTAEAIEQTLREIPLSLLVRSDWYAPGGSDRDREPAEFQILLSTGGPACRIIGNLTCSGEPCDCEIQWQDWGTPWTALDGCLLDSVCGLSDPLEEFASLFWFGE